MLSRNDAGELATELVEAKGGGDAARVVDILHGLVTGPRGDALNVALLLTGVLSMDLGDHPEGGFHRVEVNHVGHDGRVERGDSTDLPGHVATFVRMVVAIANGDHGIAKDLFLGYVGDDGRRALALLALALNEVVCQNGMCPTCGPEKEVTPWTG